MPEETLPSKRALIFWGLFSAGMGAFIILGASGLIGFDLHPSEGVPSWIGICAGGMFVAAGLSLIVQSLAAVNALPNESLAPGAPTWARWILPALGLAIAVGFAAIALWIAFGPGPRHFSMTGTFGSDYVNEIVGRAMFGFGAVLACLILVVFLIRSARDLTRRD